MTNYEETEKMSARPVGIAMSDGSVAPFEVLGGIRDLAERRGLRKSTIATWWARYKDGSKHPFPRPVARYSVGPLFYQADIDTYDPIEGRWPREAE